MMQNRVSEGRRERDGDKRRREEREGGGRNEAEICTHPTYASPEQGCQGVFLVFELGGVFDSFKCILLRNIAN